MVACRYEISFLAINSIYHSFAALTREIWSYIREDKCLIYKQPFIILYFSLSSKESNGNI